MRRRRRWSAWAESAAGDGESALGRCTVSLDTVLGVFPGRRWSPR
jgi:hypothetical protein